MEKGKSESNSDKSKDAAINLYPLTFEEVLEDLLKIRPIENKKLAKNKPKAKSKSKVNK